MLPPLALSFFFFFNDTATTEIYTLSLHDALPICARVTRVLDGGANRPVGGPLWPLVRAYYRLFGVRPYIELVRSEEHTSELQSRPHLVCRLLLEKKTQTEQSPPVARSRTRLTRMY